jgi:hypothetical protein
MAKQIPEDFHALYDRGFRTARRTLAPTPPQLETAGHGRLAVDVPDLVVEYDEATQLPNRVVSCQPTSYVTP